MMRGHLERHRRFHRRHDFRLQRVLFWWFGITVFFTCLVAFGVMRAVSPEVHSWRNDANRVRAFATGRFARVWDDPPARAELVQAVSRAFDASVQLEDAHGNVLERAGGSCERDEMTMDVTRGGQKLGIVRGCLQHRGLHWGGVAVTLFAVFLTIWAATAKLTRALTRPLRDLTRVTREIGEGK